MTKAFFAVALQQHDNLLVRQLLGNASVNDQLAQPNVFSSIVQQHRTKDRMAKNERAKRVSFDSLVIEFWSLILRHFAISYCTVSLPTLHNHLFSLSQERVMKWDRSTNSYLTLY